jgi:rod shape-determining protein MreD
VHSLAVSLLTLAIVVMQTAFFPRLGLLIKPDLFLVMVVAYTLVGGIKSGTIAGFALGLVEDLLSGGFIGVNTMTKSLLGFSIGLLEKHIFHDQVFIPSLLTFISTILNNVLGMLIIQSFDQRFTMFPPLGRLAALALFNALLAPLIFIIVRRMENYYARLRMGNLQSQRF